MECKVTKYAPNMTHIISTSQFPWLQLEYNPIEKANLLTQY